MKKQYINIELEEYRYLLEILGDYKLLCYIYNQEETKVIEKEKIGFKTEETKKLEMKLKR